MNTVTKIAALSPVALAAVGLTQFHYVVSHFSTIAEVGAAVAVGAAVWTGKAVMGKRKSGVDEQVAQLAETLKQQAQALPQGLHVPHQVINYEQAGQAVTKRV